MISHDLIVVSLCHLKDFLTVCLVLTNTHLSLSNESKLIRTFRNNPVLKPVMKWKLLDTRKKPHYLLTDIIKITLLTTMTRSVFGKVKVFKTAEYQH